MNTIPGRLRADATYEHSRVSQNSDPDGCCALVKVGMWSSHMAIHCSHRHLPDNAFCGTHDHLNGLFGDVGEMLNRRFRTPYARRFGLKFPPEQVEAADKALAEFWGIA